MLQQFSHINMENTKQFIKVNLYEIVKSNTIFSVLHNLMNTIF